MLPKPKPKKKPDIGPLLDEEPAPEGDDYAAEDDDFSDLEGLEDEDELGDDLAAEGGESLDGEEPLAEIDPEQAALCERLGFTEPDQQQALIDLVRLVSAPPTDFGSEPGSDSLSLEGMI